MSTLRIYTDEAGKMPMTDDDGPFVVSAVGILGEHPTFASVNGRAAWLCSKLVELNAHANCSFVIPQPGFGDAVRKKLAKMDLMARSTRLLTGANNHYLTPAGLQQRFIIYNHCMQDVVQGPLLRAVLKSPLERVEICLDQMTMAPGTRLMLITHVKSMRQQLLSTIKKLENLNPDHAKRIRANVRFDEIHISWSDEEHMETADGGLKLAHYLASLKYRDLRRGQRVLDNQLIESGYTNYGRNITEQLIRPIAGSSVREWEQNTGLSEPEI